MIIIKIIIWFIFNFGSGAMKEIDWKKFKIKKSYLKYCGRI